MTGGREKVVIAARHAEGQKAAASGAAAEREKTFGEGLTGEAIWGTNTAPLSEARREVKTEGEEDSRNLQTARRRRVPAAEK